MQLLHIKHIVSLLLAIAFGSACWSQQTIGELRFNKWHLVTDETGYYSIELEGCNENNRMVGMPEIPTLQWIIETEADAEIEILEKDSMWVQIENSQRIRPVQPSHLKSEEIVTWEMDEETYNKDEWYGLSLTQLTPLGTMGERRLARVTIAPLKYNPKRNQILIYTRLKYRIVGLSQRKSIAHNERYIAVVPWKYSEEIAPLLQWRKQLGWEVETMYVTSGDRDSIRGALREKYRNGNGPSYILLVGGLQDIKAFSGRRMVEGLDSKWCDMYFGEYTNDWLPEAMVGRLSVNDTVELRHVVKKILKYEQQPDTNGLNKALLVAGREGRYPAPTTTNGQVNYVGEQLSAVMDTTCYRNPGSNTLRDSIVEVLREGIGLVNYTSHCEKNGWEHPTITFEDFDSIANYAGIWINNCCLSNQIGANSLGENLLKQPEGGGVGIIGSTNETFWEEDYYWSVGAKRPFELHPTYDSLHLGAIDHIMKKETLGEILLAGNMAVTVAGSPYEAYYWEIYNLFGDPATRPYLGTTPKVNTTQMGILTIGMSSIECHGEAGTYVTLWQDDKIIGKCVLDEQGVGNIALCQPLLEDSIIVTSSKAWHRPQIDTIVPSRPEGEWVMAKLISTTDSIAMGEQVTMKIAYKNVGNDTIKNHQIILTQNAEDSVGAWLTNGLSININGLAPNEVDTLREEIALSKLNEISELKMHLITQNSEGAYANQPIRWMVKRSILEDELQIIEAGEPITMLLPHKQYTIEWILNNDTPYPIENVETRITIESYPSNIKRIAEEHFSMEAMSNSIASMDIVSEDTLQGWWITAEAIYDGKTIKRSEWCIAGMAVADFEEGDLSNFEWENHSYVKWDIDSSRCHNGKYSLKSGVIGDHQQCDITLWIDVMEKDTLGFWYNVESESHNDKLLFYLNNVERFFNSGNQPWSYWEMEIPKGRHKLTWRYQKNGSESVGADAAWIDDIRLPIAKWGEICGTMDTIIYENSNGIESAPEMSWEIWPNPASNKINIHCEEKGEITLWNCMGRKIDTIRIENSNTTQYSTSQLRFGLYLLMYTNGQSTSTKKLMITP